MFKAVSSTDNMPLDLFRASLETAKLGEALPDQLNDYVRTIIREASTLQQGGGDASAVQAASIYLYSAMPMSLSLAEIVADVEHRGINQANAERILAAMRSAAG
jgi:hypothetical protein